jgi:DedD protein
MVQLGTFSNVGNANKLRDRLRKDGYDGHSRKVKLGNSAVVKVYTGPFINKQDALKIKTRLDKRYHLKSIVVFFD